MSTPLVIAPLKAPQSLYYAMRYATLPQQDAVAVLRRFIQEIHTIQSEISDISVAKTKLSWWSKELHQLYKGYPQHPLSFKLMEIIKAYSLPEQEFQFLIEACTSDLDEQFSTLAEKERYYRHSWGATLYLMGCICAHTPPPEDFIHHLGTQVQTISEIRYVGKNKKRAQAYFGHNDQNQITTLLLAQSEFAKVHFAKALEVLSAEKRFAFLSLLIFANIKMALLNEIVKSNFDILDKKISLTPLQKFWISHKTRHKEKKYFNQLKK